MDLYKNTVLVVNKGYQIIDVICPKKAFVAIMTNKYEDQSARPMLIDYLEKEDGSYDLDSLINFRPVTWEEWIEQPIRSIDSIVNTPNLKVRVPTVIQSCKFNRPIMKHLKPSKKNIFRRYRGRCAYTNKKLTLSSMTVDHVIPKSRWKQQGKKGSPDNWNNLLLCDKKTNHKKGNKLNEEAGLVPLVQPTEPKPIPFSELILKMGHVDWKWFIHKDENNESKNKEK